MRFLLAFLILPFALAGCDSMTGKMSVTDVYTFETPINVGAIFMTVENNTNDDDRIIGFKTDVAERSELHTMTMENDMMRMRQVPNYNIPAGEAHLLKPGGDHVMVYGLKEKFSAGATYDGIVVFEKAGEVPVTVTVRDKSEMTMNHNDDGLKGQEHDHDHSHNEHHE